MEQENGSDDTTTECQPSVAAEASNDSTSTDENGNKLRMLPTMVYTYTHISTYFHPYSSHLIYRSDSVSVLVDIFIMI